MSKRVLVIHYSQTGQLTDIVDRFCAGLDNDVQIDHLRVEPAEPFPFPWSRLTFFNTFPESVFGLPFPIKHDPVDHSKEYDLVILGYTIWYLAPSIPINSFLISEEGKKLMNGKKVVTLIGSRNMWVLAQEKMKRLLLDCGSKLVGNIVLVDRSPNLVSILTIIRWMFYGKKDAFMGFPKAGIRDEDIATATGFGRIVNDHLQKGSLEVLNKGLLSSGAVDISPSLLVLEKRATMIFKKYANFILAKGDYDNPARLGRVSFLSYLIPIGAFILAPITTFTTFIVSRIKKKQLVEEIEKLKTCDLYEE